MVEAVEGLHEGGHQEPRPHEPAAEEGLDEGGPLVLLDHRQGHLHEGVDEPFPLHPLLPQDRHGADHGHVEGQDEGDPHGEGAQPEGPGDAHAFGGALVEAAHRLHLVMGDDPVRHRGHEDVVPGVLRRGVVDQGGDVGQQEGGEPPLGDRRGHDPHDVDQGQLGAVEHPAAPQQADRRVDEEDQEEEQDDRRRGVEVGGDPRPVEHHVAVRHPGADGDRSDGAHEKGAQPRGGRRACVGRCRHGSRAAQGGADAHGWRTRTSRSAGIGPSDCRPPPGQRTSTASTADRFPRPKWARVSLWDR